jgi:alkylation response protein AidB-like acyl-CoA dehydrogenase
LFLIDREAPGVTVTPMKTIGSQKHQEVRLAGVRIGPEAVLGTVGGAADPLQRVLTQAKVALSAWMVGGAAAALDMSVRYAKDRVQFGQPIGSFQAIQHKLANVATEVDGARLITYRAAAALAEGQPADLEAAMAKAFVSETYRKAAAEGCQIHGGYGFMMETDIQLYFRRAKAHEVEFGDAEAQQDLIAEALAI